MSEHILITFIVSRLRRCGPTNQLYFLLSHLDREIFSPRIVTLSDETSDSMYDLFLPLAENIISLEISNWASFLCSRKRFRRFENTISSTIIHSQGFRSDLLNSALPEYSARIATQRNYPYEDYVIDYGGTIGRAVAFLHYRALSNIPFRVTCSDTLKHQNSRCGLVSDVILNGTEIPPLSSVLSDSARTNLRRSLNLPLSSNIFVVSGPLIPRKSIEVVIKAFIQYFLDHKTRAILCILGEGPELGSLSNISKGYPNIIFKGQVTNVSDYFRAADLFISASKSEGLPNSVIESLANGTPVLLSNIGPHREILDQRRDAGLIFPQNDPIALALLLKEFLPASLNRTAAWELADKFFSAIRMSKQYQALYLKMVR